MVEVKQKRSREQRAQDYLSWTLWISILFSHNGRTTRCWEAKPWWLICLSDDNAALYSLPMPTSQVQADSDFRQPGGWWCCRLRWVWSMFPWIAHHWRAEMGRVRWWVHIWKWKGHLCGTALLFCPLWVSVSPGLFLPSSWQWNHSEESSPWI